MICRIVEFAVPEDHRGKLKEIEKINKYLDLARELKTSMEHEDDNDANCKWCTGNGPQRLKKETGRVGNRRTNREHLNPSIVKIGQNTEKSPGDLRRFTVTQTPVRNHQQTLERKTLKEVNNNDNNVFTLCNIISTIPSQYK